MASDPSASADAGELRFGYDDEPYSQVWRADWRFGEWAGYGGPHS